MIVRPVLQKRSDLEKGFRRLKAQGDKVIEGEKEKEKEEMK